MGQQSTPESCDHVFPEEIMTELFLAGAGDEVLDHWAEFEALDGHFVNGCGGTVQADNLDYGCGKENCTPEFDEKAAHFQEASQTVGQAPSNVEAAKVHKGASEKACRLSSGTAGPAGLPPQVRAAALQFMRELLATSELGFRGWCEAALLLDLYYQRTGYCEKTSPCLLFDTCTATVLVLEKASCASTDATSIIVSASSILARRDYGVGRRELRFRDVFKQEMAIFRVLDMGIGRPSAFSWLSTLGRRLSVLSRGMLSPTFEWMWQRSMQSLYVMLSLHTATDLSPRSLANGLFCLGLISGGVVPLEAYCPDNLQIDEWEKTFLQSGLCATDSPPTCATPAAHTRSMVALVQATSRCSERVFAKDAMTVAVALAAAKVQLDPEP
eukprot:TRINITY_DN38033_c0_g1_i1.p1 TRINITY_DN38033_c0_g1~~TRINITY_DN38033_c0_g1_i1.p1  ORF type:complete len:385 (+),score=68.66 TRINITY_DN38033_c0_g1_i1:99-1253(+)